MLARVSSGSAGIGRYLETGRKKGREHERDVIDERFTLSGNLALTEMAIDAMASAKAGNAKYLHITLGFSETFTRAENCAENELNLAAIDQITQRYRDLLMAAYDRAEYVFYAEAHIPRVSHEINAATGAYEKRLPHVHIVIPMRNAATGQYLNPFGFGKATLSYAGAIQETINAEFGLRSPRQSQRQTPSSAHALARHDARFAVATAPQLRTALRDLLAEKVVQDFDALAKAAGAFGEVKIRQGKGGDYINVKPAWSKKGINFKEVTRQDFVVHAAAIAAELASPAVTSAKPPDDPEYANRLAQWTSRVAFEARYINSGNRHLYEALDDDGKHAMLLGKRRELALQLAPGQEQVHERPDYEALKPAQCRAQRRAAGVYQSRLADTRQARTPRSLAGLRNLSSLAVVFQRGDTAVLLQPDAPDRLGAQHGAGPALRWARTGPARIAGRTRGRVGERTLGVAATLQKGVVPEAVSPDRLKADTSATIVLADAARRFGIDVAEYGMFCGQDGTPRIRYRNQQFNLGDFYTKHLGITWEEAAPILLQCFHATLGDALPAPDADLWKAFAAWREREEQVARGSLKATREALRLQLLEANDAYGKLRLKSRHLRGASRQAALAQGRAERLVKVTEIKALQKAATQAAKRPGRNTLYRIFLKELASSGQLNALSELRRMGTADATGGESIRGARSETVLPLPSYRIDHNGKVTYFNGATAVVTDCVAGVSVVHAEPSAYDIALQIAVARYGRDLTFAGSTLFMNCMLEASRKSRLSLVIRDANRPDAAPALFQAPSRGISR